MTAVLDSMRAGPALTTRERIVAEARTWIGTPFRHQARLKGVGVDCAQLVRAVGEACGVLTIPATMEAALNGYGRLPVPARMGALLEALGRPIRRESARPGDVAWLEWREGLAMHLAILGALNGRPTIVHALAEAGRVVEHGFATPWPERAAGWFRYPGLSGEAPEARSRRVAE